MTETLYLLKETYKRLQAKLLDICREVYGNRLTSVVLYGSAARGTQRFDSDLDFLIVCETLPHGRMKRIEEFHQIEDLLEPDISHLNASGFHIDFSPMIKTREEAMQGSPVFLDMVEDSQILYDKDDFFAGILEDLKKRLKVLGAKRIWRGNAWHWDLKPDFKPGEVFEI